MPAYADRRRDVRPRERFTALAAVVVVQLVLTVIILRGLNVSVTRPADLVQRLVEINVPKPPPPPRASPLVPKPQHHQAAAPPAAPDKLGGTVGPKPSHAAPSVAPVIAIKPNSAPSGGGSGTGPAIGAGAGGGTGGNGYGDGDDGGSDLEQVAGEITTRDYPRELKEAGIGGRVLFTFTVLPNGRVGRCSITRSSGSPELDALTCRLVQQRFFYRPSTDRFGRPIADEVDGEHDWIARSR